jgi:hypothetical protein
MSCKRGLIIAKTLKKTLKIGFFKGFVGKSKWFDEGLS